MVTNMPKTRDCCKSKTKMACVRPFSSSCLQSSVRWKETIFNKVQDENEIKAHVWFIMFV